MHLHSFCIRNFRRLKNVQIDLEKDFSIFVGANNSGKTSATQVFHHFVGQGDRSALSIHDFSVDCRSTFDRIGSEPEGQHATPFPTMSLDLWLKVEDADLHRVIDLIPSLRWPEGKVGIRIEYGPRDEATTLLRYRELNREASAHAQPGSGGIASLHPWPRSLSDYLSRRLGEEYTFRYFVLDPEKHTAQSQSTSGDAPVPLDSESGRQGEQLLKKLIRIDFLNAQKHLSDVNSAGRSQDLSQRLSRFYERIRDKTNTNYDALRALSSAEEHLSSHLNQALSPVLDALKEFGYPGFDNPRLKIGSALNPASMLSSSGSARVHYVLDAASEGTTELLLPDKYNGLGSKNLLYMAIELTEFKASWEETEERPPLHLIFVEEPEAHLHTQLQQVFIHQVLELLKLNANDEAHFRSQLVVTTHSPHILHESGFGAIRYFRRMSKTSGRHASEILNLSRFYAAQQEEDRDFLLRYMKLTHCDLFFADAAILVEGNVERLLLPLMVKKAQQGLRSRCLSILELGGAFAHRFKKLLEFLSITTLIITDLDSTYPPDQAAGNSGMSAEESEEDDEPGSRGRTACKPEVQGAVTSNQTLAQWLPEKHLVQDLLATPGEEKQAWLKGENSALVRVAYQTPCAMTWRGESGSRTGRTFEAAFAFQNLAWSQDRSRSKLKLNIRSNQHLSLDELTSKLQEKLLKNSFKKTDFALALLAYDREDGGWEVPGYIAEGLHWLAAQLEVRDVVPSPAIPVEEEAA
ncbi:ATP-dependent endonuclease [Corallococcus exiguus]|uniref:ATP-dependent nuclease n=1 Tax=Corallococcus exiguus TaxID=83462 RepID=UPI001471F50D|nr:ATP-dependent endonuclease [Corallococcus exiguus]NNC15112.1 ATP-dependent endonuclease [Corallococcus exiguus]